MDTRKQNTAIRSAGLVIAMIFAACSSGDSGQSGQVVRDKNGTGYSGVKNIQPRSWQPKTLISDPKQMLTPVPPALAATREGTFLAFYMLRATSSATALYARIHEPVTGWQEITQVDDGTIHSVGDIPTVRFNGKQRATLLWSSYLGNGYALYSRCFDRDLGWQPQQILRPVELQHYFYALELATNSAGQTVAAYNETGPTIGKNYDIKISSAADSGSWDAEPAAVGGIDHSSPNDLVALDAQGNVLTAWDGKYNARNNGLWGTATALSSPARVLALGSEFGEGMLAVIALNSGGVYAQPYSVASGWGKAEFLLNDITAVEAALAVSAGNRALVLIKGQKMIPQPDGSNLYKYSLFAVYHNPDQGWQPAATLVAEDVNKLEGADLAITPFGQGLAVWKTTAPSAAQGAVMATSFDPEAGWNAPQLLAATEESPTTARVALDGSNRGIAVWNSTNGYYTSAFAARYE